MGKIEISEECHKTVKKISDRKKISMRHFIETLVKEIGLEDKEEKLIMSVPAHLTKRNKDGMKEWLQTRTDAILNAYYPNKEKINGIISQTN